MIYLELFWVFLQVGCFSFGGAYGAIPIIRDLVLAQGWVTDEMFAYIVAVSESTPGPIMVNLATYIGSTQGGFWGALLATAGVILPAFVIILLIVTILKNFLKNHYVRAALNGVKPGFVGIVLATGLYMAAGNRFFAAPAWRFDGRAALITGVLALLAFTYPYLRKKDFSPIWLIVLSAALGIAVYSF